MFGEQPGWNHIHHCGYPWLLDLLRDLNFHFHYIAVSRVSYVVYQDTSISINADTLMSYTTFPTLISG